jgi:predicted small lipoprotein YifL
MPHYSSPLTSRLLALALLASLAACGDKAAAPAGADNKPNLADAAKPSVMAEQAKETARAALPKGDPRTPVSSYTDIDSGNQLMFAYLGIAGMPIDYNEVANSYSRDYASTADEFKKSDLLKALKVKIDAGVAQAAQQRYVKLEIPGSVEKYDFEKKGFQIDSSIWEKGSYRYFSDNSSYKIGYNNGAAFRYLSVPEEDKARVIEGLRSKYESMRLVVYGYVQDADVSKKVVQAQILKLELVDKKGNVLATQSAE